MPSPRRLLLLNFNGIGNGFMVMPLLAELERVAPEISYFHIENPLFQTKALMDVVSLQRLLGTIPSIWRRFAPADHDAIRRFIDEHAIDVIVNLRNEGPLRDVGFEQFRHAWNGHTLEFWTLEQSEAATPTQPRNLVQAQIGLFRRNGIELGGARFDWLRARFPPTPNARPRIGFFTGVSQAPKRWMADRWISLGERLLAEADVDLVVYAGVDEEERRLAADVAGRLSGPSTLVESLPLDEFVAHLATLDLLVSNDTSSIHIASALDLRTVGLYFSTVAEVWGSTNSRFSYVQSRTGLACPFLKRDAGNCEYYYGGCPAPCRYDVSAERVWPAIESFVKGHRSEPTESADDHRYYRRALP